MRTLLPRAPGNADFCGGAVLTTDSLRPDAVAMRAEWIAGLFEVAHAAGEVVASHFFGFADRGHYGDRLVVTVLSFNDQHREAEFGVICERYGKSVRWLGLAGVSYTSIQSLRWCTKAREYSRTTRKAANPEAGGEKGVDRLRGFVYAVAGFVLAGVDLDAHLFSERAGDEAANAMVLMPMSA